MTDNLAAVGALGTVGLDPVSIIALAAIAIIGLPHGAFDGAVALALGYGKTLRSMFWFILVYIAIAACVVVFWVAFPVLALLLFLLISMVHFGIGDSQPGEWGHRTIQTLAHGGLVVIAISLLHRTEVEPIFAHLLVGDTTIVWMVLSGAAYGLAVIVAGYAVLAYRCPVLRPRLGELAALGAAYYVLPPLAGFALYFCAVHSMRHMTHIWRELRTGVEGGRKMLMLAFIFSLATWAAGAIALWLMPAAETLDGGILRVVFIGLAALTVPHMILVDGLFRSAPQASKRNSVLD
jgi:Brp/Blh family beta-carotene 15,15'-monooxygenase